jgi:hypothetical protein
MKNEHWFFKSWRPYLAWQYGFICLCDFVLLPCLYFWVQQFETQAVNDAYREWKPLTTQNGGLFHMAHMAIVGVSAYGRSQEKIGFMGSNQPMMRSDREEITETETIKTSLRPSIGDGARAKPPQDD